MLDSQRMPRATPETAEMTKPTDKTPMMMSSALLASGPAPETISTPWPICTAESPRVAAVPKRVAMMAIMSMILPTTPSVLREPNSGLNTEEMRGTRPRRYEEYAIAPPTSAYMAHGVSPQWKCAWATAWWTAAAVPASTVCGGGETK